MAHDSIIQLKQPKAIKKDGNKDKKWFYLQCTIWFPSQIREQIKLAALSHGEGRHCTYPLALIGAGFSSGSAYVRVSVTFHHSKRLILLHVIGMKKKNIEGSGNVICYNLTKCTQVAVRMSQRTNKYPGEVMQSYRQHLLALLQLWRLKEWLFYLIPCLFSSGKMCPARLAHRK